MHDIEKVIKGLQAHVKGCGRRSNYCDIMECPYRIGDEFCDIKQMCIDAIAMLKEQENDIHHMGLIIEEYEKELKKQEAVEPTWQQGKAYCGSCGKRIPLKIGARFCHKCGKRIKWESRRSSDVL